MTDLLYLAALGTGWGVALSFLAGPIFFSILQGSIERGFRGGSTIAAGQWFSDVLMLYLLLGGTGLLRERLGDPAFQLQFKHWTGIAGGLMLIGFGLHLLLSKVPDPTRDKQLSGGTYLAYFAKGFFLNTVNPFPWLFWLAQMAFVANWPDATASHGLAYFGGIWGTIVVTDLLKVVLARKLRPWVTPRVLYRMRKVSGLAFLLFGLLLLYRTF